MLLFLVIFTYADNQVFRVAHKKASEPTAYDGYPSGFVTVEWSEPVWFLVPKDKPNQPQSTYG